MTLSDDAIRLLLDDGPWTDARSERLAREVGGRAEAERLVAWWRGVEAGFRHRIAAELPDPDALVLMGIEAAGHGVALDPGERDRVAALRARYDEVAAAVPAVDDVVRSVAEDARAFDEAWTRAFVPGPVRRDRPAVRRLPLRRVAARLAMVASVAAFAVMALLVLQREGDIRSVAAGEGIRMVSLEDGSSVRLLSGATLSYREDGFDRRVTLDGRGYFTVRPGDVPFQVITPDALVTVLGTSFGVDADPGETSVVLVSGRVAVAPAGAPEEIVILEPGQRTRVTRGGRPSAPTAADAQAELDWTRLLFFRSTPMPEVADRLGQAFGIRVAFDESMAADRLTGTFERDREARDVLQTVAAALGAHLDSTTAGTIRLRRD